MNLAPSWLSFVIYSLAVFRLSLMLSEDSGPWKLLTKFRSWLKHEEKKSPQLKKSDVAHGVECKRCSMVWMAALLTAYLYTRHRLVEVVAMAGDAFIVWMALSGAGILLSRMFPPRA